MKKIICLLLLMSFLKIQICFAIDYSSIDIQLSSVPLNSRLKKDFSGYQYTITNNLNEKINILSAQIINGHDGNSAYMKSEAEGGIGTTWAIAGPVGLFTLGIGWVAGLVATPIVWAVQNSKNKKTRAESLSYTNIVPMGYLNSTESVTIRTLVPIGSKPQIKLNVMDDKKNLFSITR